MSKKLTDRPSLHIRTRQDQCALIMWLAKHFDVAPPRVRHKYTGLSKAYPRRRPRAQLVISDASPMGRLPVCLHEFAHVLTEKYHPGEGHMHGKQFCYRLSCILGALHIPPAGYPWKNEYASIYTWARKHKFTDRRTVFQFSHVADLGGGPPAQQESSPSTLTCIEPVCPNSRYQHEKTCAVHTEGSHHIPSRLIHAMMLAVDQHYRQHPLSLQRHGYRDVTPQSSLAGVTPLFPRT